MNKHELQVELDILRHTIVEGSPLTTFSSDGWANFYGSGDSTNIARHNAILSKIRLIEALETQITWWIADAFFGEKRTQEIPGKIENPLFFEASIQMGLPEIRLRILHVFREAAYQLVRYHYPNLPNSIFFRANDLILLGRLTIIFSMREPAVSPKYQEI